MENYRAWVSNGNKYIMIHSGENLKENHFNSPHIKSIMKSTGYKDIAGKEIYEKDILDINTNRVIIFLDKNNTWKMLHKNGVIEPFSEYMAGVCRVEGNIFENPMVAFS